MLTVFTFYFQNRSCSQLVSTPSAFKDYKGDETRRLREKDKNPYWFLNKRFIGRELNSSLFSCSEVNYTKQFQAIVPGYVLGIVSMHINL